MALARAASTVRRFWYPFSWQLATVHALQLQETGRPHAQFWTTLVHPHSLKHKPIFTEKKCVLYIYILYAHGCVGCTESINMSYSLTHTRTHVRTHTRAPHPHPPPKQQKTTKTWKTQTRPQTHVHRPPQRAKHGPLPPPPPPSHPIHTQR